MRVGVKRGGTYSPPAMAVLLAALSAVVYGTADFAGGFASRRNDGVQVTLVSQLFGLAAIVVAIVVWPVATSHGAADLWWGALAGACGGLGLMCFYTALGRGPMSVVAPLTAVLSAVVPVAAGLLAGQRPSAVTLAGIAVALPAIGLVAREPTAELERVAPATLGLAALSGLGFGGFFVAVSNAGASSGMWPLLGARLASVALVGAVWALRRLPFRPAPGTWVWVVAAGVVDVFANALYLLAVRQGELVWVAVIGAMYPVSTVILARTVLGERLWPLQRVGLVLAAGAVALVAAGR